MAIPRNLTEAIALLTPSSAFDRITGQDVREAFLWAKNGNGTQDLTDADQTINLASNPIRRFRVPAVNPFPASTVRTITIDTADLTDPDEVTIIRTDYGIYPIRIVDTNGTTLAWLNRPGARTVKFNATSPRSDDIRPEMTIYPEDFHPQAGTGDSEADTLAWERMFTALSTPAWSGPANRVVCIPAKTYLIKRTLKLQAADFNGVKFIGDGIGFGGIIGSMLKWVGPDGAVMTGTPALTLNSGARTIVRDTGSWIADGFVVGTVFMIDNLTTGVVRRFRAQAVTATTITVHATDTVDTGTITAGNARVADMQSIVEQVGCHSIFWERVIFHGDRKVQFCVLNTIDQDSFDYANSSNCGFDWCTFYSPRSHYGGACLGWGVPARDPVVGQQCDLGRYRRCYFYGYYGGAVHGNQHAGVRYLDGNNTKVFRFEQCDFIANRIHLDWSRASGTMIVLSCGFENSGELDIYANGPCTVINCNAERSKMMLRCDDVASSGTIMGCEWNGSPVDDNWVCVRHLGNLSIIGGFFANHRTHLTVTAVDVNTNVITFTTSTAHELPVAGTKVRVAANSGVEVPRPLMLEDRNYYLGNDLALSGGGTVGVGPYTCTLYADATQSGGGSLVDFKSSTAPFTLMSVPIIQSCDYGAASGGVTIDGATFYGAAEIVPVVGSNVISQVSRWGVANLNQGRVSSRNAVGGNYGALTKLRDVHPFQTLTHVQPFIQFYRDQLPFKYSGVTASQGWCCIEIDYRKITNAVQYIGMPPRTRVLGMRATIETDFTGSTGACLRVGYLPPGQGTIVQGDLLTSFDLKGPFAANPHQRRRGYQDSHFGTKLLAANRIDGGWSPWETSGGADYGWSAPWNICFRLTQTVDDVANDLDPSTLSGGLAYLYILVDTLPDPTRVQ